MLIPTKRSVHYMKIIKNIIIIIIITSVMSYHYFDDCQSNKQKNHDDDDDNHLQYPSVSFFLFPYHSFIAIINWTISHLEMFSFFFRLILSIKIVISSSLHRKNKMKWKSLLVDINNDDGHYDDHHHDHYYNQNVHIIEKTIKKTTTLDWIEFLLVCLFRCNEMFLVMTHTMMLIFSWWISQSEWIGH